MIFILQSLSCYLFCINFNFLLCCTTLRIGECSKEYYGELFEDILLRTPMRRLSTCKVLRMNNKLKRRFYKGFVSIVLLVALRTFRTYLIQVTHNNCNSPKTIDFVWYLVLTNLCSLPLLTWVKMISKCTILFHTN